MSNYQPTDSYYNPHTENRKNSIYKNYSRMKEVASLNFEADDAVYIGDSNPSDYLHEAGHVRFPTMVNCSECHALTMTDIEYEHGFASTCWCLTLMPFLCTGACCLCLNSCKDVKHYCGRCHKHVGTNRSKVCWSDYILIWSFDCRNAIDWL